MRVVFALVLAITVMMPTFADPAHSPLNALYLVTYIDLMPNAVVPGATLLKRYCHTREFRESLSPMEGALYDERFYKEPS